MLTLAIDNTSRPSDLMTINELCQKHGFKYGYLYKWSCLLNEIKVYSAGKIQLSESEVLQFEDNKRSKKYGRNK